MEREQRVKLCLDLTRKIRKSDLKEGARIFVRKANGVVVEEEEEEEEEVEVSC